MIPRLHFLQLVSFNMIFEEKNPLENIHEGDMFITSVISTKLEEQQ